MGRLVGSSRCIRRAGDTGVEIGRTASTTGRPLMTFYGTARKVLSAEGACLGKASLRQGVTRHDRHRNEVSRSDGYEGFADRSGDVQRTSSCHPIGSLAQQGGTTP